MEREPNPVVISICVGIAIGAAVSFGSILLAPAVPWDLVTVSVIVSAFGAMSAFGLNDMYTVVLRHRLERAKHRAQIKAFKEFYNQPDAGPLQAKAAFREEQITFNSKEGQRVHRRYIPLDPREREWRIAAREFLYWAWLADGLTVEKTMGEGRALGGPTEWKEITDGLAHAGLIVKRNGVRTGLVEGLTYKGAIDMLESPAPIDWPPGYPPTVRTFYKTIAPAASPTGEGPKA